MKRSGWIFVITLAFASVGCGVHDEYQTTPPTGTPPVGAAAKCSGNQPVRMKTRPLSPYVYQHGDGYAYFDVWIQACPLPGRARRQPLDIALVVDTSGSMGGRKIEQARAAASYLLSVLGPTDRLSLVTYNTQVLLQFPLSAVTNSNRAWMQSRINSIYASGMTNLGGGLSVGAQQLTQAQERNAVSRVILISDGLANVGVVSPVQLNAMASGARMQRASVTTMGVGLHFNELLLQSLAEYGGGRYHYISRAQDLVGIFRQEIQGVQAVVATGIDLRVDACPGCRIESVPGYAIHRSAEGARIAVSDLAGGEVMKALVKVRLPQGKIGARQIGLRLAYNAVGPKRKAYRSAARVDFRVTGDLARVRRTVDSRVAGRVARVQANLLTRRAMTAYQAGNAQAAGVYLQRAATHLRSHARRYKKRSFSFSADNIDGALIQVRKYRGSSKRGRHLLKKLRYKSAAEMRR